MRVRHTDSSELVQYTTTGTRPDHIPELSSELISGALACHSVPEGEPSHPVKETRFSLLCPQCDFLSKAYDCRCRLEHR